MSAANVCAIIYFYVSYPVVGKLPLPGTCQSKSVPGLIIRYPFFIVTIRITGYWYFKCNEVNYYLLQKLTSYVAKLLLRYFEDQKELLFYLNKTVTNATPSGKLKTMPRFFHY
jgi:hypothetical protein